MPRFVIGLVSLSIAALVFFAALGVTVAGFIPGSPPVPASYFFILVAVLVLITGIAWSSAVSSVEGDDPFSGERGRLVSAMVVAILLIGLALLFSLLNLDAWRGFIAGWRD